MNSNIEQLVSRELDEQFWNEISVDGILKFNPKGKYDRVFSKEYKVFLDHLHNSPKMPQVKEGSVVKGLISKLNKKELVIDINYKDSVYIDLNAFDLKIIKNLKVGDELEALIVSVNNSPYEIKGSISDLIRMDINTKFKTFYRDDIPLNATVTKIIPAGFMLNIELDHMDIEAFMPNTLAGVNKLTDNQNNELLGKNIEVMLETLEQEKGVYVVSRKKYLKTLISDEIKKLEKSVVYTGTITGTRDFGVFVEFNTCLTGMIHKVNLNPDYQDKIESIKPGTEIDFYVKDILKGNKIILSQNLNVSLWDTIKLGQVRTGMIKSIKPFGLLIELDQETIGLIQAHHLEKLNKKVEVGDEVNVKVISVIKNDRKIYLSFA